MVAPRRPAIVDPSHDLLRRGFWYALWLVLVVSGLAVAAAGLGGTSASQVVAVRAFGWPALALPLGVLVAALRRRTPAGRSPDLVLVLLGMTLEASALARMHDVLGVLLGVG